MSLILEALKKSEAERRLGRAPDLLTPAASYAAEDRPWWKGVALGAASTLLVAGLGVGLWWWQTQDTSVAEAPVAVTATVSAPDAVVEPRATRITAETNADSPEINPEPSTIKPTPQVKALPPPTLPNTLPYAPVPEDPDFLSNERESIALPGDSIPMPPESVAPIDSRPMESSTPVVPPRLEPWELRSSRAPHGATEPALEALPLVNGLLAAEREGLPPLRVSMHVFDPEPTVRFVMMDGRKLRQGDIAGEGVVVDEIRPDGVVITWKGKRLLVRRP